MTETELQNMSGRRGGVPDPIVSARRVVWGGVASLQGTHDGPREIPIVLTYNRSTHAVVLAILIGLEDFANGFSLSEGILEATADIQALDIVTVPGGIECRIDLGADRLNGLSLRQPRLAGPGGCGLCGLDSLAAVIRPAPSSVPEGREFPPAMAQEAMRSMQLAQTLNAAANSVHAAAF